MQGAMTATLFKMEVDKAIFSFRSKKVNFVASAFNHKLVFGPISSEGEKEIYEELKCFEIEYGHYHNLYIGFFPLVKFLSGKSQTNESIFLERNNLSYKWKVSVSSQVEIEPEIMLFISDTNDPNKFSITFSLNEFNDLIYLLTELCFLSLNLTFPNFTIFMTLSCLEFSKLLTFQNKNILRKELQEMNNDFNLSELKLHCTCELVFYNLDVIICIHKLRLLHNDKNFLTYLNIKAIEECEKQP